MKLLPALLSALLLLPQAQISQAQNLTESDQQISHVLNRLTFGARPGDVEKVRSIGIQKFIEAQLNPSTLAESPVVTEQLQRTAKLRGPAAQLIGQYQEFRKQAKAAKRAAQGVGDNAVGAGKGKKALALAAQNQAGTTADGIQEFGGNAKRASKKRMAANGAKNPRQFVEAGVVETKLVRAVESPRQLNELMDDFWFNHFNVCMNKGLDRVLIGAYEEQAIRPYAMGNFRDLLGATMHHPAMMFYLDNAQNTKAGFQSDNPKNKKRGINENYARELLELHTLGVDGGYTQKDVMELARVLTGWGMPGPRALTSGNGTWATFDERRHDFGDKVVLGQTIKGTGAQEIEQVLDMLAKHPSTAHHLSYQMAQYFVADEPPDSLVQKLTERYNQTNGNIKLMLTTLFASPEFWDIKYQNNKFKTPFHYTVSAYRATGSHVDQAKIVANFLKLQGQPVYACLTPDGYKNTKAAWLNPDGLLKRMDFATRLAGQQIRTSGVSYQSIAATVNGGKLSDKTQKAIDSAPEFQKVAALIGSPEFMHY